MSDFLENLDLIDAQAPHSIGWRVRFLGMV